MDGDDLDLGDIKVAKKKKPDVPAPAPANTAAANGGNANGASAGAAKTNASGSGAAASSGAKSGGANGKAAEKKRGRSPSSSSSSSSDSSSSGSSSDSDSSSSDSDSSSSSSGSERKKKAKQPPVKKVKKEEKKEDKSGVAKMEIDKKEKKEIPVKQEPVTPAKPKEEKKTEAKKTDTKKDTSKEVKKEIKKEPNSAAAKKKPTGSPTKEAPKRRALKKTEADYEPLNRWWERPEQLESETQWKYLEHRGMLFTPKYVPHGVKMKYNGEYVEIPPDAEEIANYWCTCIDTDWAAKEKFRDNFWKAFTKALPRGTPITSFAKCDFRPIKEHLDMEREKKKTATKEQKEALKKEKDTQEEPYRYALVDWIREKVGNFRIEPPGLFRGRGEHPKAGMLKARIFPEEVTMNVAEDAPVPKVVDVKGHAWKDVVHDPEVTWLAYYRDSVNNQFKYVFLSAASGFKGASDLQKYEKARKLKNFIDAIRKDYQQKMKSSDVTDKQLGTAVYLIDVLALRVGGEKDTDEEADTVGCCSLRAEHITEWNDAEHKITLDFLGKDSIRYFNTVQVQPEAYKNLKSFAKGKKKDANIFDSITVTSLNLYLKSIMPELSAKVFRTYNASITLEKELAKIEGPAGQGVDLSNPNDILKFYNDANREVAILCNHQRSVPKQHEASLANMQKKVEAVDADIKECEDYLHQLKTGKTKKEKKEDKVKKEEGEERKPILKGGEKQEQVEKKLEQLKARKANMELQMKMKDDNKTVSLSTSKINYMDPRITVAFCKRYELPIEKVFNKSLRTKFPWAMYATSDFHF